MVPTTVTIKDIMSKISQTPFLLFELFFKSRLLDIVTPLLCYAKQSRLDFRTNFSLTFCAKCYFN